MRISNQRASGRQCALSTVLFLAAAGVLSSLSPVFAADPIYVWQGSSANNNWNNAANWVGNAFPPTSGGDEIEFTGSSTHLTSSVNLTYAVDSIVFTSSAAAYNISTSNHSLLTMNTGVSQSSANTETIGFPFAMGASQTWTFGSGAGDISLVGGGLNTSGFTLNVTTSSTGLGTIDGQIGGTGSINVTSGSTLVLTGANTYKGGTTLSGGSVSISSDANLGGALGNIMMQNFSYLITTATLSSARSITLGSFNGEFSVAPGTTTTLTGIIGGTTASSEPIITGGGTLVLTGQNTYQGGTTINQATVSVSSDANLGATPGGIVLYDAGTLLTTANFSTARTVDLVYSTETIDVAPTTTATFSGTIFDIGQLVKIDSGTLVLTGTNTYTGGTNIAGGVLSISSNANLGNSGGVLTVQNGGTLATTATLASTRSVALGAGGGIFDVAPGTTTTLLGAVSGPGSLSLTDGGTLVLSDTNSYSGGTILSGGTLSISSDANLGSPSTGVTFQSSASLATTASMQSARAITLHATGTFDVAPGTTLTLTGGISGSSAFTKTDGGTLVISGASNYPGVMTIAGGNLTLPTGASLVNTLISVGPGGTLNINGGSINTGTGSYFQLGNSPGSAPAIVNMTAGIVTATETDEANVEGSTAIFNQSGGTNNVAGGLYLGISDEASGTYNLSGGTLNTTNTYVGYFGNGTFNQTGGTHTVTNLDFNYASAAVSIYNLSGGTLIAGTLFPYDVATFNFNGGTLEPASNSLIGFMENFTTANVQQGGAIINTNGFNLLIAQPLVHDTSTGAAPVDGGLIKQGQGTLALTGTNTYTGGTTVTGGTLSVATDAQLGAAAGAVTLLNGSNLVFTGGNITTGRTFNLSFSTLSPASGSTINYAGALVTGGYLLGAQTVTTGGASFIGTTLDNGGTLSITGDNASFTNITNAGTVMIASGKTLTWNNGANAGGTITVNGTVNVSGLTSSGIINISGGGTVANSGTNLLLLGGSRTSINSAPIPGGGTSTGTLSTTGGTIELNGGLLVNNGTITGTTDVNFDGLATGAGSFGTVNIGVGGTYSPGNGQLVLPNTASTNAFIIPATGNQLSHAAIQISADAIATINSTDTLANTGGVTGVNYIFTKTGTGTFTTPFFNVAALDITAGKVSLTPHSSPSVLNGLTITSGATLDLINNALILNYSSSSPLSSVQSEIAAAYDHGAWDLPGLTSSAATRAGTAIGYGDNTLLNKTTFDGQSVGTDAVLMQYTWLGDANLDGIVNPADLAMMSSSGTTWTGGDFNYDGKVNADDYALFTLGAALSGGQNVSVLLPEPSFIGLLFPFVICFRRTRK
jgi:autotransporter-associated beta strand protein